MIVYILYRVQLETLPRCTALLMTLSHVGVGAGNDVVEPTDVLDFEGTLAKLVVNLLLHF